MKSADLDARACRVTAGDFIIIVVLAVERYWLNSGPIGKGRQPERPLNTIARLCSFDGNVAGIAANLNAFTAAILRSSSICCPCVRFLTDAVVRPSLLAYGEGILPALRQSQRVQVPG